MNNHTLGVSVLICSYNGAKRIAETLRHLHEQRFTQNIPWEVVLIDNASNDNLVDAAQQAWSGIVPLRIIHEMKPGVAYARITGMEQCAYEFIAFIDDDNWATPEFVQNAYQLMLKYPDAAAIGGDSRPVLMGKEPAWFKRYARTYAVGMQFKSPGIVEDPAKVLWGAGCVIRKTAWRQLAGVGFTPILRARTRNSLMSGEDTEIFLCFRILGWKIVYEPVLTIQHCMPAGRLTWNYLLRLKRGLGASSVYIDIYKDLLDAKYGRDKYHQHRWTLQLLSSLLGIIRDPLAIIASVFGTNVGNHRIVLFHAKLGSFVERVKLGWRLNSLTQKARKLFGSMKAAD
jgi:glycosyltransferase involved in cell wall biosynthesis